MCHVHAKVPDRIVDAMSAFVYGALKMKIPEKQRTLLTGIRVNDGFALVRAIRSTVDGVTESPLSILAQSKKQISQAPRDDSCLLSDVNINHMCYSWNYVISTRWCRKTKMLASEKGCATYYSCEFYILRGICDSQCQLGH